MTRNKQCLWPGCERLAKASKDFYCDYDGHTAENHIKELAAEARRQETAEC